MQDRNTQYDRARSAQQKPETVTQLAAWQRRVRSYFDQGVGAGDCLTGACNYQAAYASGEHYGEARSACDPCSAVMSRWGTAKIRDTGHYRLPRSAAERALSILQSEPGPVRLGDAVDRQNVTAERAA